MSVTYHYHCGDTRIKVWITEIQFQLDVDDFCSVWIVPGTFDDWPEFSS